MGKKKAESEVFFVKAALWGRGIWSTVLVIVPASNRPQALARVSGLLGYHTYPASKSNGRFYVVSAKDQVYLVRATSSDQARISVETQSGNCTKHPVHVLTMTQAPHPHRSAPFTVASRAWRCRWCGCRDMTLHCAECQVCPSCGRHDVRADKSYDSGNGAGWSPQGEDHALVGIDISSDDGGQPDDARMCRADDRGWPPIEIDPDLAGIDGHRDQYYS